MHHRTTVLVVSLILSHELSTIQTLYDEAFGFLQGKAAKNAGLGNVGVRDRKCVRSLKKLCFTFFPVRTICSSVASKCIGVSGGDPQKVMMHVAGFP